MSNIIPPMVSSSPPPMDDAMEEDEDDEFGDFATAEDTDVPPIPVILPTISNTFWGEECKTKQNGICNGNVVEEGERKEVERITVGQDNTSQDSVVSGTTDSGLCSASQNSEGASPSPVGGSSPSPVPDREESSGSDETLVKSVDTDTRACSEIHDIQTDTIMGESINWSDNFDNFSDFQSVSEVVRTDSESEIRKHLHEEVDEFGDFESVPATRSDDFEQFELANYQDHCSVPLDKSDLFHRLQTVVTSLFPLSSANLLDVNVSLLDEKLTALWLKLKDVEASHALSYQWTGSAANKCLLMALGIDSRNILFGARWNTSVPRFAANLGFSPLEPVRANRSPPAPTSVPAPVVATEQEGSVPAAQFDWNSSGLVNPLDCANSALLDLDYLNTFDNLTSSSSSSPSASNMAVSGWRISTTSEVPSSVTLVQGILAGPTPELSSGSELVQRILASSQSTPAPRSRDGLSAEAVRVLDELPDLSFLQAKLLMFPVRGTSP